MGAAPAPAIRRSEAVLTALGENLPLLLIMVFGLAAYFTFPDDLGLLTRMVTMGFLVVSLDLVVGYCGVATLGHAALFGAGAYAAGIANVQGGIGEPLLLAGIGAFAGLVAGLVSGAVILRVGGLSQLVMSIATLQLLYEGANKLSALTGGSDGLSGIAPAALLGIYAFDLWGRTAYLFGLGLLIVTLFGLNRIVASPFGLTCRAMREDPIRMRAMGADAYPALLKMYAISGAVAGLGGAVAAISTGIVGLDALSFERSAEALVMLVLGGSGSLFGAVLGTVVFVGFEHVLSSINPFHWLTIVGALLIGVVLVLPHGLRGLPKALLRLRRQKRLGG